jgi:DNA-binding NtrC family response regulator
MRDRINVLLVMAEEEWRGALPCPTGMSVDLTVARNCTEARDVLAAQTPVDVVVAALTLEDGNWWSVFHELAKHDFSAEMIVVAPRRGLDVSGILAHGVYAVLGKPVEGEEVWRTIEEAAAHKIHAEGPRAKNVAVVGGSGCASKPPGLAPYAPGKLTFCL